MSALRLSPPSWPRVADELGFRLSATGEAVRNGSALVHRDGWLSLCLREPFAGDPLRELLGAPGLWRGVREGGRTGKSFDLPPILDLEADEEGRTGSALEALLAWAEATREGVAPERPAPSSEEIAAWVPPPRRQIRAGSLLAQVEPVATASRLALVIPTLACIPEELPPARRAWLEELCTDAQLHWRMVRLGIDDARGSISAEVDLSGAPTSLAQPLLELGLAALTRAAGWALPSLALAADPGVTSRLLDRSPRRATARRNHRKENACRP